MSTNTDRRAMTGVLVACAGSVMLFAALASSMIVRRGLGDDWTGVPMPAAVWASLVVVAASSVLIEMGRRGAALALGVLFVALQALAWRTVAATGISAAFFYVLSGVHAAHAAGGLLALGLARRRAAAARAYWHFVGVVWGFLVWLFGVWA